MSDVFNYKIKIRIYSPDTWKKPFCFIGISTADLQTSTCNRVLEMRDADFGKQNRIYTHVWNTDRQMFWFIVTQVPIAGQGRRLSTRSKSGSRRNSAYENYIIDGSAGWPWIVVKMTRNQDTKYFIYTYIHYRRCRILISYYK